MLDGSEEAPKAASCADNGMLMAGAGFVETTMVAFIVTEPDGSLAVSPRLNPVTALVSYVADRRSP